MTDLSEHLSALGSDTKYSYDKPDALLLERFPAPSDDAGANPGGLLQSILITCPEFTSLCPKTGQPDFATIIIEYMPGGFCVESKALKLYLGSFRMHGEFHESCVNRIANDLVALLDPLELSVQGQFTPRGGIPFWPTSHYTRADASPR